MKSLTEFASTLKCGKQIREGLKIKKDTKIKTSTLEFNVPKYDDGELYHEDIGTVEIPRHKYFLYYDAYRQLPHFSSIDDMLCNVAMFWTDFEDLVNIQNKFILYSSNNAKDVLEWIFENFFNVPLPKRNENLDDYLDKYEDVFYTNSGGKKIYDDIIQLCDFYFGLDKIDENPDFDVDDENSIYTSLEQWFGYAD